MTEENPTPLEIGGDAGPSDESRTWAVAAHLSAFAGALCAVAFVGPLAVWLIRRDRDPYATRHARAALNFNLTLFVGLLAAGLVVIVTFGLGAIFVVPLVALVALAWVVLVVVAAVRASRGEWFEYPLSVPFVR